MGRFQAYMGQSDLQLLAEVLEAAPGESISDLLHVALRRRHAELFGCQHDSMICAGCGAEFHRKPSPARARAVPRKAG